MTSTTLSMIAIFITALTGLSLIFWIWMVIDVAKADFKDPNNKIVWLVIVICLGAIGALIYFFAGRNQKRR